ncbi:MAG: hypothetical protein NTW02_03945 [Cyanobium sp. LacPavin_0920_WC12_MAG_62_9]|nr:hypothetical protein [Cyanobium sp. LacPavin_0920_WC12_MAG_62_9]
MAPELKAADCTQRLADQLQTLSQVAEILTFRVLELEERLAGHEVRLEQLLDGGLASGTPLAEGTELRLVETEDRLARLESLLNGVAAQAPHQDEPVAQDEPIAQEEPINEEEPFLDDHEFARPNFERQEFERPQFGHQRFERHQVEGQQIEHEQIEHDQAFMDELSA